MSSSPVTAAPRLSLIDLETASEPLKDAFALLPVINVFRAMANAETLYPYFGNYMLQLFRPMELDKALEQMIVLYEEAAPLDGTDDRLLLVSPTARRAEFMRLFKVASDMTRPSQICLISSFLLMTRFGFCEK
jgi:hypothetical protein